jgi:RNA methyltransferase, TrmH family
MESENNPLHHSIATAPLLKTIARLQCERQYRDKQGLYFVEGVRNFIATLENNQRVETLLYSEKLLTSPLARKHVRQLKRAGVPFASVSPEQFRTISKAKRASGVGVILRQNTLKIKQVTPGKQPCWVVLNQVRLPGNFGTLIRTCAAIGGAGFILLNHQIDPFDPNVIRASMGAFFTQSIVRANTAQLKQWVEKHNLLVVGASPDGTVYYDRVNYSRPTLLMLGEERKGLTKEQWDLCHHQVRIPMTADTDSLNLGVAGSLLMYEVMRATT